MICFNADDLRSTITAWHFQPAMDYLKDTYPEAVPSYPPWWAFKVRPGCPSSLRYLIAV